MMVSGVQQAVAAAGLVCTTSIGSCLWHWGGQQHLQQEGQLHAWSWQVCSQWQFERMKLPACIHACVVIFCLPTLASCCVACCCHFSYFHTQQCNKPCSCSCPLHHARLQNKNINLTCYAFVPCCCSAPRPPHLPCTHQASQGGLWASGTSCRAWSSQRSRVSQKTASSQAATTPQHAHHPRHPTTAASTAAAAKLLLCISGRCVQQRGMRTDTLRQRQRAAQSWHPHLHTRVGPAAGEAAELCMALLQRWRRRMLR
jgi:hypothetical protein